MLNITNIPAPRVEFVDPRTGLMSREWYRFFLNLFQLVGNGNNQTSLDDLQVGPPPAQIDEILSRVPGDFGTQPTQESALDQIAELQKLVEGIMTQTRSELGTMSELQQANLPWVTFDTTPENVPTDVGTVAWDGGTTLGVQMTTNVLGRVNESGYYYIKASSAITKGQVIMFTGSVGASGVPTGAPATGVTDGTYIMGVAAENIANNGFGLVQFLGTLRGVDTSAFSDGDVLWYDPAVTGGLTKTKPSAPNVKVQIAAVISATNNGTILIRVNSGSVLGGTDSNVQFGPLVNKDFIQYDSALQYWKNVAPGALTKTDDTNVTLTLGGTPGSALLAATSLTLGWTGQLSVARGGTGVSTAPANGQLLIGNGTGYTVANLTAGSNISISNTAGGISISSSNPGGTVTSVGLSAPTGFSVSGSPVTGSGTLALAFAAGYSLPTTASQTNWDTAYTDRLKWDGGSTGLVAATGRTSLGATTVGSNLFTLTNPSAITFLRVNTDNTVSALDAATFRTAIGAGTGNGTVTSVTASSPLASSGGATPNITITGSALTKTDDTNVTLTLGGSASTALLAAASLTLGWTGTLAVARGGTGTGTAGITAFNNITGYSASGATGTTSTNIVFSTSPTLTTPKATSTIGVGNATPAASGAGITFPASISSSSDVNTLDDYEEGTWTPTLSGDGGSAGALAFTSAGTYTKIGRMVKLDGYIALSALGSYTGRLRIGGVPFSSNVTAYSASWGSAFFQNITAAYTYMTLTMQIGSVSYTEVLVSGSISGSGGVSLAWSEASATTAISFSLTYITTQ